MNLELYRDSSGFNTLAPIWNDILHRSNNDIIFLTHEWQSAWWESYAPGELYIVAVRDEDDAVIGIAPWFIADHEGEAVLHTIGCVDVTDYLDIIVLPEYEQAFYTTLAEHIATTDAIDRIDLCNIPQNSATLATLNEALNAQQWHVTITQQEVCPVITLPESWDDYLMQLNKKQRHELRRKIRRAGSTVDWYIVDDSHAINTEIETFIRLMAASNPEKAEFLENSQHVAFFMRMIPAMQRAGWLQLNFLTVEGEPAAAYLNFDYNNHILVYNSGQDVEQFGAYSAGIVLLAKNIRLAIEQGKSVFDFLRGDENYKYQMGGQDTHIFRLKAQP